MPHDGRSGGFLSRRVTVKIRDAAFRTTTRSVTLDPPTDLASEIFDVARRIVREHVSTTRDGVRLLGVAASQLVRPRDVQHGLFPDPERERMRKLERTGDELRRRFGEGAARRGRLVDPPSEEGDRRSHRDE